jgi:hypothetical protein
MQRYTNIVLLLFKVCLSKVSIFWHVDLLLENYHKISNYTMAVTRQWPVNSTTGMLFSVWSALRCYKRHKLVEWVSDLDDCCSSTTVSCCYEKWVAEAWNTSIQNPSTVTKIVAISFHVKVSEPHVSEFKQLHTNTFIFAIILGKQLPSVSL